MTSNRIANKTARSNSLLRKFYSISFQTWITCSISLFNARNSLIRNVHMTFCYKSRQSYDYARSKIKFWRDSAMNWRTSFKCIEKVTSKLSKHQLNSNSWDSEIQSQNEITNGMFWTSFHAVVMRTVAHMATTQGVAAVPAQTLTPIV